MCPDSHESLVAMVQEIVDEMTETKRGRNRTDSEKSLSEVKTLPVFRNTQIRLRKAKIEWERKNPQKVKTERSRSVSLLQQFTQNARRRNTF